MLEGLKLDFIPSLIHFVPSSCCILMKKQALMHEDVELLQYCNLFSHDNAASQLEIHLYVMDCRQVQQFRFVVSQSGFRKNNLYAACNYSSGNSFYAKITEFFQMKKILWSLIKSSLPPWLATGFETWQEGNLASFCLLCEKKKKTTKKPCLLAWIISYWLSSVCATHLVTATCRNPSVIYRPYGCPLSASSCLLCSLGGTHRVVTVVCLGVSFGLQVIVPWGQKNDGSTLASFPDWKYEFFYITHFVHLYWRGQSKKEYCLMLSSLGLEGCRLSTLADYGQWTQVFTQISPSVPQFLFCRVGRRGFFCFPGIGWE